MREEREIPNQKKSQEKTEKSGDEISRQERSARVAADQKHEGTKVSRQKERKRKNDGGICSKSRQDAKGEKMSDGVRASAKRAGKPEKALRDTGQADTEALSHVKEKKTYERRRKKRDMQGNILKRTVFSALVHRKPHSCNDFIGGCSKKVEFHLKIEA